VTKPGGYVGLNESYWIHQPPPDLLPESLSIGTAIITEGEWRAIWESTVLEERRIQDYRVEAKQEVRDRIKWVGWRSILPAWGRVLRLFLRNPGALASIKEQLGSTGMMNQLGYALFVGRKPWQPGDEQND